MEQKIELTFNPDTDEVSLTGNMSTYGLICCLNVFSRIAEEEKTKALMESEVDEKEDTNVQS